MNAPQVIRKAERYPNGRIAGAAPPVLIPRIWRMLTPTEYAAMLALTEKRQAVERESMAFLASLGLDPRGQYVFHKSGAVTERGRYRPRY